MLHLDNSVMVYWIIFLPQIYSILITNDLHLYGTKMFPQFE